MADALTAGRLRKLLAYDPATGEFVRRVSTSPRARAGCVAGSTRPDGYRQVRVDGRRYYAHRLAWMYVHGRFPKNDIDHANGDPSDNRIANLREATRCENMQNICAIGSGASGLIGASRDRNRWCAQIKHNKKHVYLGSYASPQEAHAAYLAAKTRLHSFQPEPRRAGVSQ